MVVDMGTCVGVISLGMQVCQGLVKYYGAWDDAPKDVQKLCASAESLVGTLRILQSAINMDGAASRIAMNVLESIQDCSDSIDELKQELLKVQNVKGTSIWSKVHGQGRRLLYPFKEGTLLKLRGYISDIRDNLSLALDVLNLQTAISTGEQLDHLSDQIHRHLILRQHDQESQAIIDWLSPLSFYATQNNTLRRRQEGTGRWLFETAEFQGWLTGSEKVLWCTGLPGAGKTILASAVIDKLTKDLSPSNSSLAFIYCNYREQGIQTLTNLLASLVQQLVQSSGDLDDSMRALYNAHKPRNTRPAASEYSLILKSLVTGISNFYVVIDALDECTDEDGTRSGLIRELQQSPPNLHFLCTSRYIEDFQRSIPGASRLEIRAHDSDVEKYLAARISESRLLAGFCEKKADLRCLIITGIVQKVHGMFLLAQFHIESLATKTTAKKVRDALDTLPEQLTETYLETVERIRRQNKEMAELAFRLLTWVTYAFRPLNVGEIQHAMAAMDLERGEDCLDEDNLVEPGLMISACGGLLDIDTESNIVRLVHYTTQEFFEKSEGKILHNAQSEISRACIRYLSLSEFAKGPCSTSKEGNYRATTFRLFNYASHHWGYHARGKTEDVVAEEALCLLSQNSKILSAMQAMVVLTDSGLPDKCEDVWFSDQFPSPIPRVVLAAYFGTTIILDGLLQRGDDIDGCGENRCTALSEAASCGHEETVKLLLENGANIEGRGECHGSPLHKAAENGYDSIVTLLLQRGANIEAKNSSAQTPLLLASTAGKEAVVELLLTHGANIEAKDKFNVPTIHKAAHNGHGEVVKVLLRGGADIEARDGFGRTPIHEAVGERNSVLVELLLNNGANTEAMDKLGRTPLHGACGYSSTVMVELLLRKGAEIEAQDKSGRTPLYLAALYGNEAVVELLLSKGANIEAMDNSGSTPLHEAARDEYTGVVELLLKNGININAMNEPGQTFLQEAAGKVNTVVAELLLSNGANIEAADKLDRTPLHEAAVRGNEAVVELLLTKGANIEATDKLDRTPLHEAAIYGHEAVVELLLSKGANIEAMDNSSRTPLHEAPNDAVAGLLLRNGANIEARDCWYQTPLHDTVRRGNTAVTELLLSNGANIEAMDQSGRTPLHLVAMDGEEAVAELLLRKGANIEAMDISGSTPPRMAIDYGRYLICNILLENGATQSA